MNKKLICPTCGESFVDHDFCPYHGLRLVPQQLGESSAKREFCMESEVGIPAGAGVTPLDDEVNPDKPGDADEDRTGKIAKIMKQFGLRRVAGRGAPDAGAMAHDEGPSVLPMEARGQGWAIAGPVLIDAGVDRWPVERRIGEKVVSGRFHRFHSGALTNHDLYERLGKRETMHLPTVWFHGTVDKDGTRLDYELLSLPVPGQGLKEWLAGSRPSEQRALHLLPLLAELLRELAASGVRPIVFEPAWLLMSEDKKVWLTTAAALADVNTTGAYHVEFEHSALLPRSWAAPELTQQGMLHANSAVFSLGQVLAHAVWGQPCSLDEILAGRVPFKSVSDPRLAWVMMGCLWPRAAERWTVEQVIQAAGCHDLQEIPEAPPWESLAPGASGSAFAFAGVSFWRLEDLLAKAVRPEHWDEALVRMDAILDWAEETAWAGQVGLLRRAIEEGRSPDWVLVALTRAVLPDTPLTWRTLDLSDGEAARSLAGLAQRALRGEKGPEEMMLKLFNADLRGAFTEVSHKSQA